MLCRPERYKRLARTACHHNRGAVVRCECRLISPQSPWQNGYAERLIRQPARFLVIFLAQTRLAAESPMNQRRIDEHEQSMQLHMWLGAAGESPRYGVEGDLGGPM